MKQIIKPITILSAILFLFLAVPVWSQAAAEEPGLDADLFPPDQVMRFQSEIELTPGQSRSILEIVQKTQKEMLEVQWKLQPEVQALRAELAETRVNEKTVLAHLNAITSTEARAKELQLLLMVRVKNVLTPEQQRQLKQLRGTS